VGLETTTLLLNALPLLVTGPVYLVLALQEAKARRTGAALAFGGVAVAAGVLGVLTAVDRSPLGGHVWLSFVAILAVLAGGLAAFVMRRAPEEPAAAQPAAEPRAELSAVSAISAELGRAEDADGVARVLVAHARQSLGVNFAALALLSDDGTEAHGVLAVGDEGEVDWWPEVHLDLLHEPSGIAAAAFEAAPLAIFDAAESAAVNRALAARVGARSAAFIPLVASGRVAAVLVAATTTSPRSFAGGDLALLEALAAEAALALDRTRSASALADALERERLMASIGRKVRSELDLDAVMRVAVRETGKALDLSRCFVRLGEGLAPAAEWHAPGYPPIGDAAVELPVSNLAARERRTVVIDDVATAVELDDESLGSREDLVQLRTDAVIATPVVVFDEMIGILALHRPASVAWSPGEITVAEAAARELGLAFHTARLLGENRERLDELESLLEAARVVGGELHLETVLQRLVEEVARLLDADAADCFLVDEARGVFRCAAVHGLPDAMLGFEFPLDRGLAATVRLEGRPVLSNDYASIREPVPGDVYAGFVGVVAAPMSWSSEIRGVLAAGSRRPSREFTAQDANLLDAFAGLAALAIRNAESFERGARQARVERGFYRIASVLGEPLSLTETLDAVAQAACTALGGASSAVFTPGALGLELTGRQALPPAVASALEGDLVRSVPALTSAAGDRQVLAASELDDDERLAGRFQELATGAGYRSLLAIPVEAPRTEECGLVLVFFDELREFVDEDLELAARLAQAARGAVERGELYEGERKARALAQQLASAGGVVSAELDPAAALDEVAQRAPALLGADAGAVWVEDEGGFVAAAVSGADIEDAAGERAPASVGPVADAARGRVPVALTALADDSLRARDPLLARGFGSFLGVPLALPEGEGALAVYSRAPRTWRREEAESLSALAGHAKAALANADLYQRVAQEKERSVAILANIADGIVAVDREGRVVLWNAAAERITGVPASEALGLDPSHVLQRTLESAEGTPDGDRLVSIRRGSEEVWLSLTEAVMRDPLGAVSGRIFAFRDISADRAVEQMKSDFVSAVSHELRTPLTSIYGFAETLLRADVAFGDEERGTFLRYIASESERLTTIVDALLNVARLDTGDLAVHLVPVDVRPVVSSVVEDVEGTIMANGHRLEVDLPAEPLDAQADADKLRQILSQLVDNALRYSPGGGTVRITGRRRDSGIELTVVDEGIGIPQSERERIFRKFYRGEAAARDGRGGTGLGLFIAHGLVSAMGGRIWVDSREGEGSTFAFELPGATSE
jgi:PAS domain S-box-containing protein